LAEDAVAGAVLVGGIPKDNKAAILQTGNGWKFLSVHLEGVDPEFFGKRRSHGAGPPKNPNRWPITSLSVLSGLYEVHVITKPWLYAVTAGCV
jgi:hypothetical protein